MHRGELLAVLENKDLAAAVVSAQGELCRSGPGHVRFDHFFRAAGSRCKLRTSNVVDTRTALASAQKLYDSEKKPYQQGAIARKQLDLDRGRP